MTHFQQNRPKESEKDIQRAILDWLAVHRIFHYRQNTGGFRDSQNHFYRFGHVGAPDIVAVVDGRYVGIEVKGPKGRQREEQKQFQQDLERAGGVYVLARGLEEVEEAISRIR